MPTCLPSMFKIKLVQVMKRLWSVLACLGITRAYITGAEKVEKVYFASHALTPKRFCPELIRGGQLVPLPSCNSAVTRKSVWQLAVIAMSLQRQVVLGLLPG